MQNNRPSEFSAMCHWSNSLNVIFEFEILDLERFAISDMTFSGSMVIDNHIQCESKNPP